MQTIRYWLWPYVFPACVIGLIVLCFSTPATSESWRVGDRDQPWQLYPVSFLFRLGPTFKPDYDWGGQHAAEIAVDEDGDGLIDEDRVDLVDEDGDGLFNEDPLDGMDNDRDGLIDEDGPDPQFDNDGDGLLNEDGLNTGGEMYDETLLEEFAAAPFFRYKNATEAAADGDGWGSGFGSGDDDFDARYNEDPADGRDNDGDGLIDEDDIAPKGSLPAQWSRRVFGYDVEAVSDITERRSLQFHLDTDREVFWALRTSGDTLLASPATRTFSPSDWIRPIRLNPQRNVVRIVLDRFLEGYYFNSDPLDSQRWGSRLTGTGHGGEGGHGQVADGDIFTARAVSQRSSSAGFRADLRGLFQIDLLRLRPRPDFGDRTPTSFDVYYGGDGTGHIQEVRRSSGIETRLNVNSFAIPRQVDQARPPVKEYRFDGGEFGDPRRVRVFDMRSGMPEGQTWELAEFEAYGSGYAMDASYVTEIIDVGTATPRYRRYFDLEDSTRPVAFESVRTLDEDRNGEIGTDELARTILNDQFNLDAAGRPVTWGKVRWRGQVEGREADVLVRVRSGTSLDTYVYNRRIGADVLSPFIDQELAANTGWPARGTRIDAFMFSMLSGLTRPTMEQLSYNTPSDRDGVVGGWTFWSAPFSYAEGAVDEQGEGGVYLPLPPLTRFIQFRFDFVSNHESGISLDYIEFDYATPFVGRGVVAEIFPDTTNALGVPVPFHYVIKPTFEDRGDAGFNRIDLVMPSAEARLDSLLIDDLPWEPIEPVDGRAANKAWLDGLTLDDESYAVAVYRDTSSGQFTMGIKTRELDAGDFPLSPEKDLRLVFSTPVFKLMTEFDSWVWNDQSNDILLQPTDPGNAVDQLPSDKLIVTVRNSEGLLSVRHIGPNPFTPNGDGINDHIQFDVGVYLLTQTVEASVSIFTLGGELVRHLSDGNTQAGALDLSWDGRNDAAKPVAPGVYIYRVLIDSDQTSSAELTGTIAVVH